MHACINALLSQQHVVHLEHFCHVVSHIYNYFSFKTVSKFEFIYTFSSSVRYTVNLVRGMLLHGHS